MQCNEKLKQCSRLYKLLEGLDSGNITAGSTHRVLVRLPAEQELQKAPEEDDEGHGKPA